MASLKEILAEAVTHGVTPGLAAGVTAHSSAKRIYLGHADDVSQIPVGSETFYDLASLTKILCTTLLTAQAIEQGKLILEEEPWPNWPGVSVRHVLHHTSGLPAWAP